MTCYGGSTFEVGIPLQEEQVEAVHFGRDGVHDGLTVGGAVVEKDVQDRVVDEVPQAVDARQGDSFQVSGGGTAEKGV